MMARVDLKLGFSCNNRCVFCVQGDKRDRYPDRSTDEVRALLAEARQHADELVLTGGEVTVRADLPEIVEAARELGFRVIQLQTNGRVLGSERAARRLVEAGVTELSPALHGPTAAVHDALTRSPGSFRQTLRGVRNARALGVPVVLNSVVVRANLPHLRAMVELFVALGVRQFQLAYVHPLGTALARFDEVVPRFSEARPHLLAALDVGVAAGVRCMTEAVPLCVLGRHRRLAAEWIIPPTRIVDAEQVVEDYTAARVGEGKAKGPPCRGCRLDPVCEGPWREYPERYGWDELKAVA